MSESCMSRKAVFRTALIALLIPLAACGGSSGGGTASPPPPPAVNTAALPITADNAQDITESVLGSISATVDLVTIADVVGLPAIASQTAANTKPVFRDTIVQVTTCDTGEITTTWEDADENLQVSTGDSFNSDFDMCFFPDPGITIDGTSTIADIVVNGDPVNEVAPWAFAGTFGFVDLAATDSIDTVTINGDLDLAISSDDNVVTNASIGAALLSVDIDGTGESLSDYLVTVIFDLNAQMETINAGGTFTSDRLEGSVTFETLEDFIVMGNDNPSSGQMLISDTSSSVLVTALDNLNVQLDIDLDLDGTIDETIVVTWSDLDVG